MQEKISIGNSVTSLNLPDGEMLIFRVFEATILGEKVTTLLSTLHIRENLVDIDDRPRHHNRKSFFEKDDIIVPLTITKGMMTLKTRKPSKFGFDTCAFI